MLHFTHHHISLSLSFSPPIVISSSPPTHTPSSPLMLYADVMPREIKSKPLPFANGRQHLSSLDQPPTPLLPPLLGPTYDVRGRHLRPRPHPGFPPLLAKKRMLHIMNSLLTSDPQRKKDVVPLTTKKRKKLRSFNFFSS